MKMQRQEWNSETVSKEGAILIIDDQPSSFFVLGQILRQRYRVHVATSGQEGLAMARKIQPNLILLDISMPEMDGYAVCTQLKSDASTQRIPVVFMTSSQEVEDEGKGLELGAIDYFVKPVHTAIILARIRNHLQLQETLRALADKNRELERQSAFRAHIEQISRHELKNSLGMILHLPMFLQEIDGTNQEHMKIATMVERVGCRMLEMINNTLALHKMESGSYALQPVPVEMVALVNGIVQEMQPLAISKRLELLLIHENEMTIWCPGEEPLLHSMVSNLIKNAIEASPKGQRVTIRMDRGITLRIHNHGSVPDEVRARLFDKFATSGKPNGSGLGGYSAMQVILLHGGRIIPCIGEEDTEIAVWLPNQDGKLGMGVE